MRPPHGVWRPFWSAHAGSGTAHAGRITAHPPWFGRGTRAGKSRKDRVIVDFQTVFRYRTILNADRVLFRTFTFRFVPPAPLAPVQNLTSVYFSVNPRRIGSRLCACLQRLYPLQDDCHGGGRFPAGRSRGSVACRCGRLRCSFSDSAVCWYGPFCSRRGQPLCPPTFRAAF